MAPLFTPQEVLANLDMRSLGRLAATCTWLRQLTQQVRQVQRGHAASTHNHAQPSLQVLRRVGAVRIVGRTTTTAAQGLASSSCLVAWSARCQRQQHPASTSTSATTVKGCADLAAAPGTGLHALAMLGARTGLRALDLAAAYAWVDAQAMGALGASGLRLHTLRLDHCSRIGEAGLQVMVGDDDGDDVHGLGQ